jgi:hypothetical protein
MFVLYLQLEEAYICIVAWIYDDPSTRYNTLYDRNNLRVQLAMKRKFES